MEQAAPAGYQSESELRAAGSQLARFWWLWLVAGVVWVFIALSILQFDEASIRTVGTLVGIMFLLSGLQNLALARLVTSYKWIYAIFGVLLLGAGVVSLINPEDTFAGLADILGFLFLIVGTFWTLGAFAERESNDLWWIGLLSGILMIILAFWTSGQFFIERAYLLLVFAGIWALMHGVTDIVRAFQVRRLPDELVAADAALRQSSASGRQP
jgi:uncharacterized membrane protein HdeD (DUF308 family)